MKSSLVKILFIIIFQLVISNLLLLSVQAKNYTVTKFTDEYDAECTLDCSLRDAVIIAHSTTEEDTITLSEGTYKLTLTGSSGDGTNGNLIIHKDLTINGQGMDKTTIDASSLGDRLFYVSSGSVNFSGITFKGGTLTSSGSTMASYGGGAITSSADTDITIINSRFSNNESGNEGGAVSFYGNSLTISGSYFLSNKSVNHGGAVTIRNGLLVLDQNEFTENEATAGAGGAVFVNSKNTVTITNSLFSSNKSYDVGGAISLYFDTILNVDNSFFENNEGHLGGAISTIGSGTINKSTFKKNKADEGGGAVYGQLANTTSLLIENNSFISNSVLEGKGGAVYLYDMATAVRTQSVIIQNSTFSENSASEGGGLCRGEIYGTSQFILVKNSTFVGNNTENEGEVGGISGRYSLNLTNNILLGNLVDGAPSTCENKSEFSSYSDNLTDGCLGDEDGNISVTDSSLIISDLKDTGEAGGQYYDLIAGSQALDNGDTDFCESTDQLGNSRIGTCDIGSIESSFGSPEENTNQNTSSGGAGCSFRVE